MNNASSLMYGCNNSIMINGNYDTLRNASNTVVINGTVITPDILITRIRKEGGIISKDTLLSLDSLQYFNFPAGSSGSATIKIDSAGVEVSWGDLTWDSDGTTHKHSGGAYIAITDTEDNFCFYNNSGTARFLDRRMNNVTYKCVLKMSYYYP
jgi:hypothetical protein